jgi:hypothetical protein
MRGLPAAKQQGKGTAGARRPFEDAKGSQPSVRFDWEGGVVCLIVPWISFSECLRNGPDLVMLFGNIEVTIKRKRREAEKAGWQFDELLSLIHQQKLFRIFDDPELGCIMQAYRVEPDADGNPQRVALAERYRDLGIGEPEYEHEVPEDPNQ